MLYWGWVSSFGVLECLGTTVVPQKSLTDYVTWKLGPLPTCLVLLTSAVSFAGRWSWIRAFPGGTNGEESACQGRRHERYRFDPWVGKIPWRTAWQPTPVFLPGESHGQRSLEGYSPGSQRAGHD